MERTSRSVTGSQRKVIDAGVIQIAPDNVTAHLGLAATYVLMGRDMEARAEAAGVLRINPKFFLDYYAKLPVFKDQSERDEFVGALRKAGLK